MAGLYPLSVNGTLVVPTRRPDTNITVIPGNLAQCKPIIASNQTTFPGQYPVAAVDSSNGTAWQPSSSSPAYIVVDLESQQPLTGVHINWGEAPAQSFQIQVSNDSVSFTTVLETEVQISAPYNETLAVEVEIQIGNVTTASLNTTARYPFFQRFGG
jgi:F5/8 type C domain